MKQLDQVKLGFSQMRAAISGGHSLVEAFNELAGMTGNGSRPDVVAGGLGCLLVCIEAIERAGQLPELPIPRFHQFLHSGHKSRLSACYKAVKSQDLHTLGELVAVMSMVIEPHGARISFNNKLPTSNTGN